MKKLILSVLLIMALFLAACGDKRSDKEVVVDAFQSIIDAESYDATASIDLNVGMEGPNVDPFVAPYLDAINNLDLSFDLKYDKKAEKQESTINVKGAVPPISFDVSIPIFQDLKDQKLFIQTDSLIENFGAFFPIPEDLKGKLVMLDISQYQQELAAEEVNFNEMSEKVQKVFFDFLENKEDADYSEKSGVYTVSFTKDELKGLIKELVTTLDDTLDAEAVAQMEADLNEMLANVEFNKFEIQTKVDGDTVEEMSGVIDLTFEDETGTKVTTAITLKTVYNSINKDIDFTINPEGADTITFEEISSLMMQMQMGY